MNTEDEINEIRHSLFYVPYDEIGIVLVGDTLLFTEMPEEFMEELKNAGITVVQQTNSYCG